jgi:uncharacterized protein YjiS (DUF1127 family)
VSTRKSDDSQRTSDKGASRYGAFVAPGLGPIYRPSSWTDTRLTGRMIAPLLTTWIGRVASRFEKIRQQRALAALSDRQLRDAGIDLALAGRGKAAAVSPATLRWLQSLS